MGYTSKLRELDKKCELQNVRHEELILEMATIKRSQGKECSDWETPNSFATQGNVSTKVQTSPLENFYISGETMCVPLGKSTPNSPAVELRNQSEISLFSPRINAGSDAIGKTSLHLSGYTSLNSPKIAVAKTPCDMCGSTTPSSAIAGTVHVTSSNNFTATGPGPTAYSSNLLPELCSSLPMPVLRSASPTPGRSHTSSPLPSATGTQIDLIMAKIEQDNKILAELDKTRATIGLSSTLALGNTTSSIVTKTASDASSVIHVSAYQTLLHSLSKTPATTTQALMSYMPSTTIPTIITTTCNEDADRTKLYDRTSANLIPTEDFLDVPGKGRVHVYIARYSYDPFHHSPNENPEAELSLSSGDYIYVTGIMDEDGFFEGELLNGKRGLVPSNFVERLKGVVCLLINNGAY
uniref:SH3 domain-containing protein n=1 Tax=Strigamia maritima TaxID=126957 RepID=T1IQV1_STRMM